MTRRGGFESTSETDRVDYLKSTQTWLLVDKERELERLRGLADKLAGRVRALERVVHGRDFVDPGTPPREGWRLGEYERIKSALGERLGSYFSSLRPVDYPFSLRPRPGNSAHWLSGRPVGPVGVFVFGLDPKELAAAVKSVASSQRQGTELLPVFFTDSRDASVFRKEGFVFEYFPNPDKLQNLFDKPGYATYLQDKLRFAMMKWGIVDVLRLGTGELPGHE